MSSSQNPIKILHVLNGLGRGGIETWLLHILRNYDKQKFQMDFLISDAEIGAYGEEVLALGSKIYQGPHVRKARVFEANLQKVLCEKGPYHVVHSHFHFHTGRVLKQAQKSGVPIRVAHSHTSPIPPTKKEFVKRAYQAVGRNLIWKHCTHAIGISEKAAHSLYGENWKTDKRFEIVLYGFDFGQFRNLPSGADLKNRLGIPANKKVVGHVGRFMPVKNHKFLVEIFHQLVQNGFDGHLLFVGDGQLEEEIKAQVAQLGLADIVLFAGSQSSTAPFFGAMDLFLFPSHYEGLGIVALEAASAGLPVLASSTVPKEIEVIPDLCARLELEKGAKVWAETAQKLLNTGRQEGDACAEIVAKSSFGIQRCLDDLYRIYRV